MSTHLPPSGQASERLTAAGFSDISMEARRKAAAAFRALNDSPIQQRLREERPAFGGVVYWHPEEISEERIVSDFTAIRAAGFGLVRLCGYVCTPTEIGPGEYDFSRTDRFFRAAEKSDLLIQYMGFTADEQVSDAMLQKHGFTREQLQRGLTDTPAVRAMLREFLGPIVTRYRDHPALFCWSGQGEPAVLRYRLDSEFDRRDFAEWLRAHYPDLDALNRAWSIYLRDDFPLVSSFSDAYRVLQSLGTSAEINGVHHAKHLYAAIRDMHRFYADRIVGYNRAWVEVIHEFDPVHPVITGNHILLHNQAQHSWDLRAWARSGDANTASIHLSWHFTESDGEIDVANYLQARKVRDYFKGGFAIANEVTGGPVQYSGGLGNHMSPALIRRTVLSYISAGMPAFCLWMWNARPAGWEAGEYGMLDYTGVLSPWGAEAGCIANALSQYGAEVWDAESEPVVGVLEDWDNQAILSMQPDRRDNRAFGGTARDASRAQIGIARVLDGSKMPYEVVTSEDLLAGISCRYPVIYAVHLRSISDSVLEALGDYVESGGRLIADAQFALFDERGRMRKTGSGSLIDRLFGASQTAVHDSRTVARAINGVPITSYFADIRLGDASTLYTFDDGAPAATVLHRGRGKAVLLGFEPGMECWKPANAGMESLVSDIIQSGLPQRWRSSAPIARRLVGSVADHYFLLNTTDATKRFTLEVFDRPYASAQLVLEAADLSLPLQPVEIAAGGAVWIRCVRAEE